MPITPLSSGPALRPSGKLATDAASSKPIALDYFEPQASLPTPPAGTPGQAFPRAFGVEIEMVRTNDFTLRSVSRVLQQALPGRSRQTPQTTYQGNTRRFNVYEDDEAMEDSDVYDARGRRWEVKNDEPNIEVATPILRTHDDLATLQRVIDALEQSGATCDNCTGVHVHVDAQKIDVPQLTYLLALVARHEPYIFSALQVESIRRSIYCRPLALAQVKRAVRAAPQSITELAAAFRVNPTTAKFVGVNLEQIFTRDGFGTIEFRYFNGCLDPHAIGCYVGYAMALMHHTATEAASPAPEARASLPELLKTLGLQPKNPVSRLLCDKLRQSLEALIGETPHLAKLVRSQYYTGDASLLLSMGVSADAIEQALIKDDHATALLTHAVSFMRYLPLGATASAFEHLRDAPAEHRAELAFLAKDLLDAPRLANEASAVFAQLCRVPQPQRLKWVGSAKCTPVRVLVRFSTKLTPALGYVFSQMGLNDSVFAGNVTLAKKILTVLRDGPGAIKAKVQAVADTQWLHIDDTHLRGRLIIALWDLAPEDIRRLAELIQPILAKVVSPDSYASLLEVFCETPPEHWKYYADRLNTLLCGPQAHETLYALRNGLWDPSNSLEANLIADKEFTRELAYV